MSSESTSIVRPFAFALRTSARPRPKVIAPFAGLLASRAASSASAAASVSMCAASESRASDEATSATTTSPAMKSRIRISASSRRLASSSDLSGTDDRHQFESLGCFSVQRRVLGHASHQRVAPALALEHGCPKRGGIVRERVAVARRLEDPVAALELGVELARTPAGVAREHTRALHALPETLAWGGAGEDADAPEGDHRGAGGVLEVSEDDHPGARDRTTHQDLL